MKSTVFCNYC